ncbi:hypothetical protein BH18ACI2_BH18ACI2_01490 [soil metagenome]
MLFATSNLKLQTSNYPALLAVETLQMALSKI